MLARGLAASALLHAAAIAVGLATVGRPAAPPADATHLVAARLPESAEGPEAEPDPLDWVEEVLTEPIEAPRESVAPPTEPTVLDEILRPVEDRVASEGIPLDAEALPLAAPRDPRLRTRPPAPPAVVASVRPPPAPAPSPSPVTAPAVGIVEDAVPLATNRAPIYPPEARARGWEGDVVLRIRVSSAGLVEEVEVEVTSGHAILDAAAVEAARTWRFRPALEDGRPVPRLLRRRIAFRR
jgi:protein TonB